MKAALDSKESPMGKECFHQFVMHHKNSAMKGGETGLGYGVDVGSTAYKIRRNGDEAVETSKMES